MENDNVQPVFTVGTLPKKCYTDPQELLRDFAAALSIPQDNAKVIKGAKGDPGPPGNPGRPGAPGPPGSITRSIQNVPIPAGSAGIDIPIFDNWQFSSYNILYNGSVSGDPADFSISVGVGTLVPVTSADPQPSQLRIFFLFQDGLNATPDNKYILSITTITST